MTGWRKFLDRWGAAWGFYKKDRTGDSDNRILKEEHQMRTKEQTLNTMNEVKIHTYTSFFLIIL